MWDVREPFNGCSTSNRKYGYVVPGQRAEKRWVGILILLIRVCLTEKVASEQRLKWVEKLALGVYMEREFWTEETPVH